MARARSNGIELEYEVIGNPADPPLLRFDNRDVGLSTRLEGAPTPTPAEIFARRAAGEPLGVAYKLSDMPDDTAGLLDHLENARADSRGASLIARSTQRAPRARWPRSWLPAVAAPRSRSCACPRS